MTTSFNKALAAAGAAFLMLVCAGTASAKDVATDAVSAGNVDVAHTDNNFFVRMDIDLSGYKGLNSNRDITITPLLAGASDTLRLDPIMVAGRARYYLHLRQSENSRPVKQLYQAGKANTINYEATVAYQPWMDHSDIILSAQSCGCAGEPIAALDVPVEHIDLTPLTPPQFIPYFTFLKPSAEVEKHREIKGQAYIDFPVNRTELYPTYRKNPVELAKINATIDSVRLDKDVTFKSMTIKGYASPEGSYQNNVRLAKGRTATLKEYVLAQYSFPQSMVSTSYDPEDWGGLRRYVESSTIANRDGILAIIDSDLLPDPKNEEIKRKYPEQYDFLLKEVYPGLRHSDYTVEYVVRNYTDINEIKRVLRTQPEKLSLSEMYLAASTMDPESEEYAATFETAVRLHPEDPAANLNAANIAMKRGDLQLAEQLLAKAGGSIEATYARGLLAALQGNYAGAKTLLSKAEDAGIEAATAALEQISAIEAVPTSKRK